VPGRVEEHPEVRARLVLVLGGAELQHLGLGGVEVVDVHVEMHLLGHLLGRPSRRGVALHLLSPDKLTGQLAGIYLDRVVGFLLEPPPEAWDGIVHFSKK